ncbi:MAG: caspase family protein [Anaerolineales bacterium]|nr:caspase family protein [Anaerolineales bacterium]MCB0010250.1 caspase family protein [Anaerolineales bacterium]
MQPQHSNDLIYSNFDLDGVKALCAHPQLQVEYEDLGGSTKRTRAIALTQYLTHRGRLLDLFIALNGARPHLDLSPCFHELIAEQFSTAETMGSLFGALGLTLRDFQEPERFPWGDFAWCSDKARKLQTYYYQQGQWTALQQTVAAQSRPPLSLETLQRLFPGPGQPVAAVVAPPANDIPAAIAPDRPVPAINAPFQEALERGQLALFIGADFPQTVTGLPSRADLAQALAQRHGLPAGLTLAQAAQRVSRAGNRYEFTSFLRDALSTAGKPPAAIHQRLAALVKTYQLKTIITTAYDDLLEQALRQAGVPFDVVVNNSDVRFMQPDRLTLIKLYGTADRVDTLVVTEQDHTQLLRDRERDEVLSEVRRALAQNTVYFLGYNLADPDFAFIYDQVAENRFARTAYALWPGLPQVEVDMWRDRRLVILHADPLHLVEGFSPPAGPPLLGSSIVAAPPENRGKGIGEADDVPTEWLGKGNRWAVLVGVNQYEDWQNYGSLEVCVQDVTAIQQALIAGGYEPERIHLLTDDGPEIPTRANILSSLQAVAAATEPGDSLLFYYSGHGSAVKDTSYLVARDGRFNVLGDTAVSVTRIKEIMNDAPARAKVIILDACHSGAQIGKGAEPMSAEFIRRVFEEAEGMVILASCKQGEKSYEWRDEKRSVFTHYLLEAMSGKADRDQKGFVSISDAGAHVVNYVKLWASQRKVAQTPTLEAKIVGDVILSRYGQDA